MDLYKNFDTNYGLLSIAKHALDIF